MVELVPTGTGGEDPAGARVGQRRLRSAPADQKLTVAAAADLNFALPDIARQFRASHPAVELDIAYGSSGNFFAQIRNGAPFDVFLSADVEYPRKLAAAASGRGFGLHLCGGPHRGLGARRLAAGSRRRRCATLR